MIFKVENLSFSYDKGSQGERIIDGLSFAVTSGDIVSLVGPNGVGKSTLLRCMLGLLPRDTGRIELDGSDISSIPLRQFWSSVAYVPQLHRSSFAMTTIETVVLGRSAHIPLFAQPSERDYAIAYEALSEVGLTEKARQSFRELSGGQQRLALIAKALASTPSLLVLDEPETGLDYRNRLIIVDLLEKLASERGIAVIMATHYPENAIRASGKALLLERAGRARFGACDEVLNTISMQRAFNADVRIEELSIEEKPFKVIVPVKVQAPDNREGK